MPGSINARGLMLAAPSSGSGKTLTTLALLRVLKNKKHAVAGAKSGPDYIDPKFHEAASGNPSFNLDGFAMPDATLRYWANQAAPASGLLLVEGAMGLFDGAANGTASSADLADALGIPVVLIVDCKGLGQSVAPIVSGFAAFRKTTRIAGVILNRVGSDRHFHILKSAFDQLNVPLIGHIRANQQLILPSRHLGLVQAREHSDLDAFLDMAAEQVSTHLDLDMLVDLAMPIQAAENPLDTAPPFGQTIAIARDEAFAFCYPHQLNAWQHAGATLKFFSPLNDEGPALDADAVFLPGGYPELHAGTLANADRFRRSMEAAKDRNALIYGECGGYMVLGNWIVCAEKQTHRMLGFLPLETSFAERKLHLGYRKLMPLQSDIWSGELAAHEFHYATTVQTGDASPLFSAKDALGENLGNIGLRIGRTIGSFAHLI
ncbi:MAG: cobyrinate a,c-diamide synthase [Hyphomicrobiales bacterium]|uniref:cobyrinate a,c-diamide synthase n=1 Tax=Nisaea sp. TaxID=2024842 RepID=UPI003288D492